MTPALQRPMVLPVSVAQRPQKIILLLSEKIAGWFLSRKETSAGRKAAVWLQKRHIPLGSGADATKVALLQG